MTIKEYQPLAARTLANLATKDDDMTHMQLGIATEIGELLDIFKKNMAYGKPMDLVNLGEEIADLSWYIAGASTIHNYELTGAAIDDKFFNLDVAIMNKSDFAITTLFSILGSLFSSDGKIFSSPEVIVAACHTICEAYGLDYGKELEKNIAKLQARYPEKFDQEKALNRNLEAERKILEGK